MQIEYRIVDAEMSNRSVAGDLERYVNELIQQGWKQLGGVTATASPDPGYYYLAQAMVRTTDV
jgi:hypothetical protein